MLAFDDNIICKYPNSEILYAFGKGIVLVIYDKDDCGPHCVGDKWTVWFDEHQKYVTVKAVEFGGAKSSVGLCFGEQFCDEEIRQLRKGFVRFTKTI
jgi:hypothetical protein